MELYRREADDEASSLKAPYVALDRLHVLYEKFNDEERTIKGATMFSTARMLAIAVLISNGIGCGPNLTVVSCNSNVPPNPVPECQEYDNVPESKVAEVSSFCPPGAKLSVGSPCPRAGSIGGCVPCGDATAGVPAAWFYPDPANGINTIDDVRRVCPGPGACVVSP